MANSNVIASLSWFWNLKNVFLLQAFNRAARGIRERSPPALCVPSSTWYLTIETLLNVTWYMTYLCTGRSGSSLHSILMLDRLSLWHNSSGSSALATKPPYRHLKTWYLNLKKITWPFYFFLRTQLIFFIWNKRQYKYDSL